MQRFSQRESVLLGYSPGKNQGGNSDIDFDDVFGGPPRRSSVQETRYSFGDGPDSAAPFGRSEETAGLSEKPVFGEDAVNSRRRNSRNDFFDDIFKGNVESLSSSPRITRDPFATGSQLLCPARPLPPKAEPFGTSFPSQFSLPAKLNKGVDLPTFGSPTRSSKQSKDGSSSFLSRFSAQANHDKEEVRNELQSSRRFSALSQELGNGSEESTNLSKYDETETKGNLKEDLSSSENGSHFHFSIYKWADKGGVPLAIPLRGSDRVNEKDKLQRCSSANGWIEFENLSVEPKAQMHDTMSRDTKSFRVDSRNEEDKTPMSGSEIIGSLESSDKNKNVSGDSVLPGSGGEEKTRHSLPRIDLSDKQEKEVSAVGKATHKPQTKPLNMFFNDKGGSENVSAVGKATHKPQTKPLNMFFNDKDSENGSDEVTRNAGTKQRTEKSGKKLSEVLDDENIKKQDVKKRANSKTVEDGKPSIKGSPRNSSDNGKTRVKGKVKEFIKIFNQDALESHSSRQKERDIVKPEKNESSISMAEKEEKIHMANLQRKKSSPDIPAASPSCNGASEKNINSSVKDTISGGSKPIVEDRVESFDDNFLVEDLTPEEKILPQFGIDPEDVLAIDAKIRQWSNGKQGNIRSLLSTLQYVLWPDSGWKPVPLVDIIEGPAVKRSYQKALLYLHPDKLQQKGATSDQKYIAEKVFDILQDAWTHFNSLGPVSV